MVMEMSVIASDRLRAAFRELRAILTERYRLPQNDDLVEQIDRALKEDTDEAYQQVTAWLEEQSPEVQTSGEALFD